MPISFTCPHCGQQMNVADQYAGQSGPCAKCGGRIVIPGEPRGMPQFAPQTPAAPAYPPAGYPQPQPTYGAPPPAARSGSPLLVIFAVLGGVALLVCIGLVALLLPAISAARQAASRVHSANNMKLIGLGMYNYHDTYLSFPMAGSPDPQQGIGLSWRVRLLPFIEERPLYDRVDWNQPWNGPNNAYLTDQMPRSYQSRLVPESKSETVYLAIVDSEVVPRNGQPKDSNRPRPVFSQDGRRSSIADITDGTSNTVLAVEADADQAVPWAQPKDLVYDPQQPRRGLGKLHRGGFQVLMADGSVRFLSDQIDDQTLRNLMTRNDNNPIPPLP
ncbi:MAG: DUF1559 domain-containing protein [Pirellulales bacterium]